MDDNQHCSFSFGASHSAGTTGRSQTSLKKDSIKSEQRGQSDETDMLHWESALMSVDLQLNHGASACSAISVLVGASGMEWNVAKYWRALFSSALLRGHHQPFS